MIKNNNSSIISVIMPVFNAEKYLAEAIESILQQSFTNFEFFIMDDGSTDNSSKIAQEYAAKDSRIKFISDGRNLGQPKRYNKAISLSQGQYIAIMHSDDIALPFRFQRQINFLEQNPNIDLVGSLVEIINKEGKRKHKFLGFDLPPKALEIYTLFHCPLIHPSVMGKKNLFKTLPYKKNLRNSEDYDLWSRLIGRFTFATLKEVLLYYRSHGNNLSLNVPHNYEEISHQIVSTQFERLKIPTNATDWDTHRLLFPSIQPQLSIKEIKKIEKWLLHMQYRLEETNQYNTHYIKEAMFPLWIDICKRARGNLSLFYFFIKSPLIIYQKLTIRNISFMIALSLPFHKGINTIFSYIANKK